MVGGSMWISRAGLLCLSVFSLVHLSFAGEKCGLKKADIAFLLDSSRSIWKYNFMKEKKFVIDLLDTFEIGADSTHVTALTFSDRVEEQFHLNNYMEEAEIAKKISGIQHTAGDGTYIDDALRDMQADLFSPANGARDDAARIAIMLTDGEATRPEEAQKQAKLAREAGIKLLAIGVGDVNKEELMAMVTPPAEEHFFYVEKFTNLGSDLFRNLVGQQACKELDPCAEVKCQNGGKCEGDADANTFTCVCKQGWTGKHCETEVDPCDEVKCQHGGTCEGDAATNTFTCVCKQGWTGKHCEKEIDPCDGVDCQNGGTCKGKSGTFTCLCQKGWTGKHCEKKKPQEEGNPDEEMQGDRPENIKDQPKETCQGKEADVVFVLDMSSSIWIRHFKEELQFVADVVDNFDVDSGKTSVGLLAFSDDVKIHFYLDAYKHKDEVIKAIKNVNMSGGITNTHLALETLTSEMFTAKHGSRPGVAHICILITDGRSSKPLLTIPKAKAVHSSGIYMFAIGVGNMTDHVELVEMASKPSTNYTFELEGYKALLQIKDLLSYKTCEVPHGDQPRCATDIKTDIVFGLFDIGGASRPVVADFMKRVGGGFNMSTGNIRLAVQESCGDATIGLTQFSSIADFSDELDDVLHARIASLLQRMRKAFGRVSSKDSQQRFSILMLSGEVDDMEKAIIEARRLKHYTRLIVVGVGKGTSDHQMMDLASSRNRHEPDMSHVFPVADVSELPFVVKKIHILMCQEQ